MLQQLGHQLEVDAIGFASPIQMLSVGCQKRDLRRGRPTAIKYWIG